LISIIFLLLPACHTKSIRQQESGNPYSRYTGMALEFPAAEPHAQDTFIPTSLALFYPVYIGPYAKKIRLNYTGKYKESFSVIRSTKFKHPGPTSLVVFVDTGRTIPAALPEGKGMIKPQPAPAKLLAYPVFLENLTDDTLKIGYGDVLSLLPVSRQKGKLCIWQHLPLYCGNDLPVIFLPPHYLAVSTLNLYEGKNAHDIQIMFYAYPKTRIFSQTFKSRTNKKTCR